MKKLILILVTILCISSPAFARNHNGFATGVVVGAVVAGTIYNERHYAPYPYYEQRYYAPTRTIIVEQPPQVYYVQPRQVQPYCREFTQVINVGGYLQNAYGTACLQPDGSWEVVN